MKKTPSIKINAILNAIRYILKIVLPLITFPYVTRVLMPENYGKVNYCASIISYFSLIAILGTNEYAIREGAAYRDDREKISKFASQIFSLQLLSTALSYFLLGCFIILWQAEVDYKQIIIIQSISLILTTIGVDWIYTIFEEFVYITIRSFIVQLLSVILIFYLVKNTSDYKVYAGISTFAAGAGYIFNFFHSRKYVDLRITKDINLKKHIKPVLILFCNTALVSIYLNSDMTLLGIIKGDEAVGYYEVAVKIYMMIKGVLNAIVLVALPRLSAYIRNGDVVGYNKLAQQSITAQIIALFPAITGLFMVSNEVVNIMAGDQYSIATGPLRILSIAIIFAVFANFYVYIIMMTHRMDRKILLLTIVSSLLNILLNLVAIPYLGINGAALTTLIAEMTVAIMGYIFCRKKMVLGIRPKLIISTFVGCIAIIICCYMLEKTDLNELLQLVLKVCCSVVAYCSIQFLLNRGYMFSIIKRK